MLDLKLYFASEEVVKIFAIKRPREILAELRYYLDSRLSDR